MALTMLRLLLIAALGGCTAGHAGELPAFLGERAPLHADARQSQLLIQSEALSDERQVQVRTPVGFADDNASYGVIYVLDATWLYPLVAETIDYLSYWGRIPPMTVVGIPSANRNADLIPWADARFVHTGGGGRFLRFLHDELRPQIQQRYRGNGFEVLVGHSFGGVMTLHSLFAEDAAFDARVAIGSSVWVADYALREQAKGYLEADASSPGFLHLAVAEHDGGATVPANQELAALFDSDAPEDLDWAFQLVPASNHFTAVVPALHSALERLFPGFDHAVDFKALASASGADGVSAWFAQRKASLGPRFWPQVMELNLAALALAAEHPQAASRMLEELTRWFPQDAEVAAFRGLVASRAGRGEAAIEHLQQAIEIGEQVGYYPNRIEAYRATLARLQAESAQ